MKLPFLLFSDSKGKIYSHPFLRLAVASPIGPGLPDEAELVKLPKGSSLFYLPLRAPIGYNPHSESFEILKEYKGKKVYAVSAFLIPGYLRLRNPAAAVDKYKILPLWAYTACGYYGGSYYAAALRVDRRIRQAPRFYDNRLIRKNAEKTLSLYPENRLFRHLFNCALNYNCLAAKNLFMRRWEAPLPTARHCNASCIACLSLQEEDCQASHSRISFRPESAEIAEVMLYHLLKAKEAIVSFGQGCEGEPLTEADTIKKAVKGVRSKTRRGTINMNTNAGYPKRVGALCQAGVDSFRVSLSSPKEEYYNMYFKPRYKFKDVILSIKEAKKYDKFVSLNLFVFPGFTDETSQAGALLRFIEKTKIDMIQWRNLNVDPEFYKRKLKLKEARAIGILRLIGKVKKEFPHLKHGYFNLPKEQFGSQ